MKREPLVSGILLHNKKGVWFWLTHGRTFELFYNDIEIHTELGALDPEEWQE